jgi:hypothetical protein
VRGGCGGLAEPDGIGADEPVLEDIIAVATAWESTSGVGEWPAVPGGAGTRAVGLDADLDGVIAEDRLGTGRIADAELVGESREHAVCGEQAIVVGACASYGVAGVVIDGELDTKREAGWEAACANVPLEGRIGARFPRAAFVPDGTGRWCRRISRGGQGVGRREHEGCKTRWWVVGNSDAG